MDSNEIIGKGLLWPITIEQGAPVIGTGANLILSDLKILLSWPTMRRFFKENFGLDIRIMIEEQSTDLIEDIIRTLVILIIEEYEPRIELDEAIVIRDELGTGVSVTLKYLILATGKYEENELPIKLITAN